jgi:hypothetical protein
MVRSQKVELSKLPRILQKEDLKLPENFMCFRSSLQYGLPLVAHVAFSGLPFAF